MGVPDQNFFLPLVQRVHQGVTYYDAWYQISTELSFGMRSVFNWRMPLFTVLMGMLPDPAWSRAVLALLSAATVLLAAHVVQRDGGGNLMVFSLIALLLAGTLAWGFYEECYLSIELWCGLLIVLSICAYAEGWWLLGVAVGLFVLALRELSLVYCVLAAGLAWRERRWAELALWVLGLVGYAGWLLWHAHVVRRYIPDASLSSVGTWMTGNGLYYVLTTARMNVLIRSLPRWMCAVYVPLAMLGLIGWRSPMAARMALTAGAYMAAYCLVGKDDYWGLMYAPLLTFGIVWAPRALADLSRRAWGISAPTVSIE
jgi:hypothetical protein